MFSSLVNLFGCVNKDAKTKVIDSSNIMEKFRQNIEANRILTIQTLDTTNDAELEDKILANIHSKLNLELSNDKDILPTLTKEKQAVYYINQVEGAINNGGLDQFYLNNFINSDRSYMFDKTVEAFQLIGAVKFADLINRANQVFQQNKNDFYEQEGLFDKLDQEFYDTYKQENLFDLRIKFIRSNLNYFAD